MSVKVRINKQLAITMRKYNSLGVQNCLKQIDLFGGKINFTFKGESSFNTLCGGICSIFSLIFIVTFYCLKTVEFGLKLDPATTMIDHLLNNEESFELNELGYRFAIDNLDPSVATVKVL